MTTTRKKLSLRKQSLRRLDAVMLDAARGGSYVANVALPGQYTDQCTQNIRCAGLGGSLGF